MKLANIVKEVFYTLILRYQIKVIEKDKNALILKNKFCSINISTHFGEIFVHINTNNDARKISPLLWAYMFKKLEYKDFIPQIYPKVMKLDEIVKYNLFLEAQYIRLFCEDILIGNSEKTQIYFENSEKLLIELNSFYESKIN